jgi:hypothetical protein
VRLPEAVRGGGLAEVQASIIALARNVNELACDVNARGRHLSFHVLLHAQVVEVTGAMGDETDLGSELLSRLGELIGEEPGRTDAKGAFQWSLWGTGQRAWSEPAADANGWPTWRLQLRTRALAGFSGSQAQLEALAAEPRVAALAGLVRAAGQPAQLELASSLDVRGSGVGWVLWLLSVAGRIQALEARRLSESRALASAGLLPAVDPASAAPSLGPRAEKVVLGDAPWPGNGPLGADGVTGCVDALREHAGAHATRTPWGLSATLPAGGEEGARSLLELRTDTRHPLLGSGLTTELRTPFRSGLLQALALNEREVGPRGRGDAIGGWWPAEAGLVHGSFHPTAFHPSGFGVELALRYARRAREVADLAAGQEAAGPD